MKNITEERNVTFQPENMNDVDVFICQETLAHIMENRDLIESVSYGTDPDAGFKNDVFVSVNCALEHDDCPCYCSDMLDQDAIDNFPMNVRTAENIAYYISGLLGGKRVFKN